MLSGDSNTTCDEDLNTSCDEDSNKTCDEDSNTTCEEDLFGAEEDESEGRLWDRIGHQSVPTNEAYELKDTKDTHVIHYGGSSNDNIASAGFSTPQSHAINDGSSVISNSVIDGVLESALRATIYHN